MTQTGALKSVRDADVSGKRVLVRVDFNVPIEDGKIVEDLRIRAAVPTIEFLKEKGAAQVTLMTHIGRPNGKVVEDLRTQIVFARLQELMDTKNVEMLENLRFDPREEANDAQFAEELSKEGDVYINDAFAVCHRAAASTVGITQFLPSFAGLLVEKEVTHLSEVLLPPAHSVAIIGGAKFETKQPLIEKFLQSFETVLLGGALANDLLKARGLPVGISLVSSSGIPESIAGDDRVKMPVDMIVEGETAHDILNAGVREGETIMDIGPRTEMEWGEILTIAAFVVWNGPMGLYEKGYTKGTDALAETLVKSGVKAVIGGGDTTAALSKFTFDPEKIFISTGGGAMLEFLAQNGSLPAIDVLKA